MGGWSKPHDTAHLEGKLPSGGNLLFMLLMIALTKGSSSDQIGCGPLLTLAGFPETWKLSILIGRNRSPASAATG